MTFIRFEQRTRVDKTQATIEKTESANVCSGRGRSYCLIHRRYFETSWCPDCSRGYRSC
ncbi:hypothetical protein BX666DRAFT_2023200 [Dichotomocladium elegans]|nr:hypothetical protein BX666DRAFT_2023200 [Dichotomocladium elegans]